MTRGARLQSARQWLATQKGRTPVQAAKSYRKRYGVDWPCAIAELATLGIRLDGNWVAQITASLEGHHRARIRRRAEQQAGQRAEMFPDSNGCFAYIAGYTPGGAPFGITWEEWEAMEAAADDKQADSHPDSSVPPERVPF